MSDIHGEFAFEKPVRKILPYKTTNADLRIRKKIKTSRGLFCVWCRKTFGCEVLVVHHILETRIYPEYARNDLNMMVLCRKCHSKITESEGICGAAPLAFYAGLEKNIRDFHMPFVQEHCNKDLIHAFKTGDYEYWEGRSNETIVNWRAK